MSGRKRTVSGDPLPARDSIPVVIDLSEDCISKEQLRGQRKENRNRRREVLPANATKDAIAIDCGKNINPTELDESAKYREMLGPLRFTFVPKLNNHCFGQLPSNQGKKTNLLYKELVEYQLNLPIFSSSSIFVRAIENRIDLLRVLVTGPDGTPYANGCFLFDVHMRDYPRNPPSVKFITTGNGKVRFNPNLYADGKVCLSLLGTWNGPGWIPNRSTLLQLLVSIQGLILVPQPYFNEPGYECSMGTPNGEKQSEMYDQRIRLFTMTWAMLDHIEHVLADNDEHAEFHAVMTCHFIARQVAIRQQLDTWVKVDSSLSAQAQKIYKALDDLSSLYDKKQAARKPDPEIITIDLS